MHPSGLPRLITLPSLIGASASVSRAQIRWRSTYSGPADDANRSSSAATAAIGVARVGLEHDIRRLPGRGADHRHQHPHDQTPETPASIGPSPFSTAAKSARFN